MNIYKNIRVLVLMSLSITGVMYGADAERKEATASEIVRSTEEQAALLTACHSGDAQKIKTLVGQRANVNYNRNDQITALVVATTRFSSDCQKYTPCLQVLLDEGADISMPICYHIHNALGFASYEIRCRHIYDYVAENNYPENPIFSILDAHQQKLTALIDNTINTHISFPSCLATIIAQYITRQIPKESPLVTTILTNHGKSQADKIKELIAQGDDDKPLIVSTDIASGAETTYADLADFIEHDTTFKQADKESNGDLSKLLHSLMAEKAEKERALTVVRE